MHTGPSVEQDMWPIKGRDPRPASGHVPRLTWGRATVDYNGK